MESNERIGSTNSKRNTAGLGETAFPALAPANQL
jgi:hypothetical protein